MSTMGERVKQERERLGLTIPQFAEMAGAKKNTVIDWQKDVSSPPAAKLAALATIGVDVQFVITGVRSASALAPDEIQLVEQYRAMDVETKRRTMAMVYGGTPPAVSQTFHGNVGQAFEGDAVFNEKVTFDLSKKS